MTTLILKYFCTVEAISVNYGLLSSRNSTTSVVSKIEELKDSFPETGCDSILTKHPLIWRLYISPFDGPR